MAQKIYHAIYDHSKIESSHFIEIYQKELKDYNEYEIRINGDLHAICTSLKKAHEIIYEYTHRCEFHTMNLAYEHCFRNKV